MRSFDYPSRLYILAFIALILATTTGVHRAMVAAASATATETAQPIGTLHSTPTASPSITPTSTVLVGPVATRTRTPPPSPTPIGTPTSTPIVQPIPTTVRSGPLFAQEISLAAYGVRSLDAISSTGAVRFTFSLPNNWVPDGNNFLSLNVQYFLTASNNTNAGIVQNSVLQVRFDNELAASVTLTPDVTSRDILVPLRIGLLGIQGRRTHTIIITLDTHSVCLANSDASISIREDLSFFHFEYREGTPVRDLASYPQPFFNNPIPPQVDSVLFVLPSNYALDDLQAAAAMAARLGRSTNSKLQIHLTTADSLNDQDQQNSNIIAIGQVGTNALIDALYSAKALPTTLEADGSLTVNQKPIANTDGVVQIIANPKNALRSILVVTGKTREGLTKAAGAMAGPPSVLKLGGPLALISDLQPAVVQPPATHISFASLGYPDITLTAFTITSKDYQFVAPLGMTLTNGAYVDLDYDLADTLRGAQTTVTMTMNGAPVDSIAVGAVNPQTLPTPSAFSGQHLRVSIPPNSVKAGTTNDFVVRLDVQGDWKCNPPSDAASWFLIRASSEFYLPYRQANAVALRPTLDSLPSPYAVTPDLSDVLISLPDKPAVTELEQMARIAAYVGSAANDNARYMPRVTLGQPGTALDLSAYHFIVIGRVSTNPFLAELNDRNVLPQPFEKTDELKQVLDSVVYRLPASYNIGVLQVISSPWSAEHVILIISGTSAIGQGFAASVLLDGKYGPSDLGGNLVFVNSSTISVVDTTAQQASQANTSTPEISPTASSTTSATPGLVSPTAAEPLLPVYTVTPYPTSTSVPTDVQW